MTVGNAIWTLVSVLAASIYLKYVFNKGRDKGIELLAQAFVMTFGLSVLFLSGHLLAGTILEIIEPQFLYTQLWFIDLLAISVLASGALARITKKYNKQQVNEKAVG